MIQLYRASESDFTVHGIEIKPSECTFEAKINDTWLLSATIPYTDSNWQYIDDNGVIKAPTPYGQQLFRIYLKEKEMSSLYIEAYPIFLDAKNDTYIYDTRPTECDGATALAQILKGTKYSGYSNISKKATSYFERKNAIECIASNDDNSFLNRWGGEIRYDNYDIYVNDCLGEDNGMRVEFGFNMKEIQEKIDFSDCITRIRPVAYNGYQLEEGEFVDSPIRANYPKDFISEIKYEYVKLADDAQDSDYEEGSGYIVCDTIEELREELRKLAKQEYTDNEVDKPSCEYTVSVVDLSRSDKYKLYQDMLKLNLGDTVQVKYDKLGIETEARVKEIKYDCILQRMTDLTIGDVEASYFDKTADATRSIEETIDTKNNVVYADKLSGVINLMNTQMRAQRTVAQKSDVRAILFEDTDPNSSTFGALSIGTQGIQIAHVQDSKGSWEWGTAINYQSIMADAIVTGLLSDKTGNFSLNMDTGELVMNDGTFKGDVATSKDCTVGGSLFLTNTHLDGTFAYSNIYSKFEDGTYAYPRIGFAQTKGTTNGELYLKYDNARLSISDDSIDMYIGNSSTASISLSKGGTFSINGHSGLTGTYTVSNSITLTSGLVTGVS